MKNIKQEIEKLTEESLEAPIITPKQGLQGKKHCICIDCDALGCDLDCYICLKDFGEMKNFM